jgi:hypothetical protein
MPVERGAVGIVVRYIEACDEAGDVGTGGEGADDEDGLAGVVGCATVLPGMDDAAGERTAVSACSLGSAEADCGGIRRKDAS